MNEVCEEANARTLQRLMLREAKPRLKYRSPLALIEEFFDLIHLEHNAV